MIFLHLSSLTGIGRGVHQDYLEFYFPLTQLPRFISECTSFAGKFKLRTNQGAIDRVATIQESGCSKLPNLKCGNFQEPPFLYGVHGIYTIWDCPWNECVLWWRFIFYSIVFSPQKTSSCCAPLYWLPSL